MIQRWQHIVVAMLWCLIATAQGQQVVVDGRAPGSPPPVYDGIDVSSHQRIIDWTATAKDKNIKFVYIKATEGATYLSPHYRMNLENARKMGIKVGSYHFMRTGSRVRDQFENFKRHVDRAEQDLIPLLDVEVRDGWTNQQLRDSVKLMADLMEKHYGCKPMIYTSSSFFNRILGSGFADYPLFIARYAANEPVLDYGAKWILWQFSEKGRVRGIDHHVDLCRFNKGCSLRDILLRDRLSARGQRASDAVDRNKQPATAPQGPEPKLSKEQEKELRKQQEKERKARERAEKLAREEAEKKAERERKEREKQERLERKRLEHEQKEAEKERKRLEHEQRAAERRREQEARAAERERERQAKAERHRLEQEQKERERLEQQQARERREQEALKARQLKEQQEKERQQQEQEQRERERAEQERLKQEQQAARPADPPLPPPEPSKAQKARAERRLKRQQQRENNARAKQTTPQAPTGKTNKSSADND